MFVLELLKQALKGLQFPLINSVVQRAKARWMAESFGACLPSVRKVDIMMLGGFLDDVGWVLGWCWVGSWL